MRAVGPQLSPDEYEDGRANLIWRKSAKVALSVGSPMGPLGLSVLGPSFHCAFFRAMS